MPRPTIEQSQKKKRQAILDKLDDIAWEGAEDAMRMLVAAAAGQPVNREVMASAQYVINQVVGKPSEKELSTDTTDKVLDLLARLREARERDNART